MTDPADVAADSFPPESSTPLAGPTTTAEIAADEDSAAPAKGSGSVASKTRDSQAQLLLVAGASLLAYSLYSLFFLITSNPSPEPLNVIDKIVGFIGLFPPLLLGFTLIFFGIPPQAIIGEALWLKLLRQLVALIAIAYLLCVPLTTVQEISQVRIEASNLARANDLLQGRKQAVMTAIAGLKTREEFVATLSQFPEIETIRIDPNDSPAATIRGVELAIDKALVNQDQAFRAERDQRLNLLRIRGRLTSVGSLVAGLSFLALGVLVVPWISGLARFIGQLQKQSVGLFRRLVKSVPGCGTTQPSAERAAAAKARAASARRSKATRTAISNAQRSWRKNWTALQASLAKLLPGAGKKRSSKSRRRSRS